MLQETGCCRPLPVVPVLRRAHIRWQLRSLLQHLSPLPRAVAAPTHLRRECRKTPLRQRELQRWLVPRRGKQQPLPQVPQTRHEPLFIGTSAVAVRGLPEAGVKRRLYYADRHFRRFSHAAVAPYHSVHTCIGRKADVRV